MFEITREENRQRVELYVEGEKVSWLTLIDLEVYIAGAAVKMGGIGGVGTKEEHRRKGYSRRVLQKTVELMQEQGYHLSMLFGIPDYYHRWGYISCLPVYQVKIPTRAAERTQLLHSIRPYREEDYQEVLSIYEQCNCGRTGSVVRRPGQWKAFRMGSHFFKQAEPVILEKEGKLEGYVVFDRELEKVVIAEVGAKTPEVYLSVLAEAARRAIAKREGEITACVPLDHPLVDIARPLGCDATARYFYCRKGMGRIVNLTGLFELIGSRLMIKAGLDPMQDAMVVQTDIGTAALGTLSGKNGPAVKVDQQTLTQLLFGYTTVDAAHVAGRITASEDCLAKLRAVFPLQYPHLWGPDKF